MAARYSVDLRRRIVQACERGTQSQREVAGFFNVSLSFVESLLQYYRRSGGQLVRPQRRRGRHVLLDDSCRERLWHWLQEQPDLTLKELVERLHGSTGVTVSEPTMCRVLHQMGMRRKKDCPCHRTRQRARMFGAPPLPQANRKILGQKTEIYR